MEYIASHGDKYGLDTSHLAVAGDSVGGNMAAVMTLMAKENGFTPTIDFQLLLYPVTNADFDTETYRQFADRAVADKTGDGVVLGAISAG